MVHSPGLFLNERLRGRRRDRNFFIGLGHACIRIYDLSIDGSLLVRIKQNLDRPADSFGTGCIPVRLHEFVKPFKDVVGEAYRYSCHTSSMTTCDTTSRIFHSVGHNHRIRELEPWVREVGRSGDLFEGGPGEEEALGAVVIEDHDCFCPVACSDDLLDNAFAPVGVAHTVTD